MAKMYPDSNTTKVIFPSRAEEIFYVESRNQLNNDWHVFHSCSLSKIEGSLGLRDNEIDFVLYHKNFGLIVVEVKGGRIGFDAATKNFYSINRNDEKFGIKNPFEQVLAWKSRLIKILRSEDLRVPITHAVCLPHIETSEWPQIPGVSLEVIIGQKELGFLNSYLQNLVKISQPEHFLRFPDCLESVKRIFQGEDFISRLYYRDYLETHERKVNDIEKVLDTLISPFANSRRLGIEGEAGTGKTRLAGRLATHFAKQNKNVLFLTSNSLLTQNIKSWVPQNVQVSTYNDFAASFGVSLLIAPIDYTKSNENWVQLDAPLIFKEKLVEKNTKFNVVICDEGQDVQAFWWDAFKELLTEESHLYIFFDRCQGVFATQASEDFKPAKILPVPEPYFPLVNNYRNTRDIHLFSQEFRTKNGSYDAASDRVGYAPVLITYKDAADAQVKLQKLIAELTEKEKINPHEITLLSARNPDAEESVIKNLKKIHNLDFNRIGGKSSKLEMENKLQLSTVSSFKGLETNVGIMINFSEYNLPLSHPLMASLAYVAATRAKHLLFIFVKQQDGKVEVFEKAIQKSLATGNLIIENAHERDIHLGVVKFYDDKRYGFLEIKDLLNNRQQKILFFPWDVSQAGIKELKNGDMLEFLPHGDAETLTAINLKKRAV